MAEITIRILEGLERGRVFARLPTPVSIGREDDNDIQLNDDRVSRFHAKLQVDSGKVILTDLDSTNGTRVNGHPIHMRVLQAGDVLSIGRCLLAVGDVRSQGSDKECPPGVSLESSTAQIKDQPPAPVLDDLDFISPPTILQPDEGELFPSGAPEPPRDLRPLQRAQLSDLLAFIHAQIGDVVKNGLETDEDDYQPAASRTVRCDWQDWQKLITLYADLAKYLHQIANPEH